MIGTLIVDEQSLDVERVWFHDGRMWLYAATKLPASVPEGPTDVRLHAPDGTLVIMARVDMPRVTLTPETTHYAIELPIAVEGSRPGEPWATHREEGRR